MVETSLCALEERTLILLRSSISAPASIPLDHRLWLARLFKKATSSCCVTRTLRRGTQRSSGKAPWNETCGDFSRQRLDPAYLPNLLRSAPPQSADCGARVFRVCERFEIDRRKSPPSVSGY